MGGQGSIRQRGTKIRTYGSGWFDFANPRVEDVNIKSIAMSLSRICRFGGHLDRHYSVAEHSVLVAEMARYFGEDDDLVLACVHHDDEEAYVGDVVSPFKGMIPDYKVVARRISDVIAEKFNVNFDNPLIKKYDNLMCDIEIKTFWPEDDIIVDPELLEMFRPRMLDQKEAMDMFLDFVSFLGVYGGR